MVYLANIELSYNFSGTRVMSSFIYSKSTRRVTQYKSLRCKVPKAITRDGYDAVYNHFYCSDSSVGEVDVIRELELDDFNSDVDVMLLIL